MKVNSKWMRRGVAALAALTVISALAGCSKGGQESGSKDSNVLNIGGYDVSAEEYNYYFLNEKYNMDGGDDSFWASATDEQKDLKSRAEEGLKEFYAMKKLADEAGIPSDGQLAEDVDTEIANLKEQFGGEEAFNQILASNYMSPELYRMLSLESLRSIELFKSTMGEEIKKTLPERYLRAAHILISFNESAVDTEADHEEAKKRAADVLAKVEAGEDFFKLVEEYGEDPGMVDNLDGYYFTEGQMVEPFYQGALALKEGETSGLVETDYGYHIIKRLPMEDAYIEENLMTFATQETYDAFMAKVDEVIGSMEIQQGGAYDSISLENTLKENEKNS